MTDSPDVVVTHGAAQSLSRCRHTLMEWGAAGIVEPDWRTAGGHMRGDLHRIREQVRDADARERCDGDDDCGPR